MLGTWIELSNTIQAHVKVHQLQILTPNEVHFCLITIPFSGSELLFFIRKEFIDKKKDYLPSTLEVNKKSAKMGKEKSALENLEKKKQSKLHCLNHFPIKAVRNMKDLSYNNFSNFCLSLSKYSKISSHSAW